MADVITHKVECPECGAGVWYECGELEQHQDEGPLGRSAGLVKISLCSASGRAVKITLCERCGGTGLYAPGYFGDACGKCGGYGAIVALVSEAP